MAANVVNATGVDTGTTTAVTGDTVFKIAYRTIQSQGVVFYLKYTKGTTTHMTLSFDSINPSLHATDRFLHPCRDGALLKADVMTIETAGNYRIPVPVIAGETTINANITFSGAGLDGVVIGHFMES